MSSFVHVDQPVNHPGVRRVENVIAQWRDMRAHFNAARTLAAVLLAAIVAALVVVADKLVSALENGGALLAWVVLWAVAFVAMGLFANTARVLAARFVKVWREMARRHAQARADARLLAYARFDPRIMTELQAAITRAEG